MLFFILFIIEIIFLFFLSQVLTKSLSRVFLALTKSQKTTVALMAILFFPGVVIHELSHLLVAGILFVRTGEIEFIPQITEDSVTSNVTGVKLGSVAIAKTDPIRRAIIGSAPVFSGLSIILGLIYLFVDNSSIVHTIELSQPIKITIMILIFYLIFAISNTMFSSRKDLEGTIELVIVFAIIFIALYLIGFRIDVAIPLFVQEKTIEIIKTGSVFLLVPVGIDIIIVSLLRGRRLFQKN